MKWFKKQSKHKEKLFERCISVHHATLFQHALWMLGNKENAADVVQETYYQAWRSIHNLQDEAKALAWLLTILRRMVYREQRCAYQDRDTLDYLQEIDTISHDDAGYGLLEIYRLLEELTPALRETFLLNALHGFSYAEISEQLDIPIGTVMSRIARAKESLKKILKTENGKLDGKVVNLSAIRRGESQ